MIEPFFSNRLARKLALALAGWSALPLPSCGPPGLEFQYDFSSATTSTDTNTETETSDNVIEGQFAEDGSILGAELLMAEDGLFESEVTFNDEVEELDEARAQLAATQEGLGRRSSRIARKLSTRQGPEHHQDHKIRGGKKREFTRHSAGRLRSPSTQPKSAARSSRNSR